MTDPKGQENEQYLYLTATGRLSGLPREIEIWFVEHELKFYVLAEHFHSTQWVKNILRNPRVSMRVRDRQCTATARILDERLDNGLWVTVQELSSKKYGWGDGLPVEIVPDKN
jgi:deazaflavin-dependent oxidoreductase (nitroreductase family)